MADATRRSARVIVGEVGLVEPAPELIVAIAERSVADGETAHHEPFPVTAALIVDGIRAANARGRA